MSDMEILGTSEDAWPYEHVVNALLYFSMELDSRDEYLVEDFPEVLFHGSVGDWCSSNALETATLIFTDILRSGLFTGEWFEDKATDSDALEKHFKELFDKLTDIQYPSDYEYWKDIQIESIAILHSMGWEELVMPMISCKQTFDEYSYGAYSEAVK